MLKKNNKTIKDRIVETSKSFNIPEEFQGRFLSSIMELIERAKSPDLFCPKCDERMSINLEAGTLQCFNCDFERKIEMHPYTSDTPVKYDKPITKSAAVTSAEPNIAKPNTAILKAIDKLEGNSENKGAKKSSIQDLANSRGGAKVTKEDDEYLKENVPGAKNAKINWC